MADTASSCETCKKTEHEVPNMKHCAKCKTTFYCSRDCQKANWKVHKKICSTQAAARSASSSSDPDPNDDHTGGDPKVEAFIKGAQPKVEVKNLEGKIDKPFTRLDNGTFLHNLPERDVYKLLIDAFRLHQDDDYNFEGEADGIYAGERDSVAPFKRFLRLAGLRRSLLPPWWNAAKEIACLRYAKTHHEWSSLSCAVTKADIIEHYGPMRFPMQLRILAESVYGNGPGGPFGSDSTQIRKLFALEESGTGFDQQISVLHQSF